MAGSLRDDPGQINAGSGLPPRPERVRSALDGVRAGLLADGGNVELLGVEDDGTVRLELQGALARCPSAPSAVRLVIEPHLVRCVPGVTGVMIG